VTTNDPSLSRQQIERLASIIMMMQRCFVQHLSAELSRGKVSFAQFFLLGHFPPDKTLAMREIAEKMAHTTAAATGLVDRLVKLGYLKRLDDPDDRRRVLVRITPKGEELVERIRQDIVEKLASVTGILSPEEQSAWLQIYEKIHHHIKCSSPS